jgi:micrococcal nuclease
MRELNLYNYKAKCKSVYDGDTITLDIDLGFGVWMLHQKTRLLGINTPEIRGSERLSGLIARDRLRELIEGKDIILASHRDRAGKYGRWLGTIYLGDININQLLLDEGLATIYE